MPQIKGTAVLDTVQQVQKRAGDPAYQKVVGLLDDETRKIFQNQISPSSWYSLDSFTHFLEVEIKELAGGDEEVLLRGTEKVVEHQLRGIYKVFVKLGSPEFVLKRLAAVHATYFLGVRIDVEMRGPASAIVRYRGFEKQHRILSNVIIGFFRKALEISGAKNVQADFTTPIAAGREFAELAITWG